MSPMRELIISRRLKTGHRETITINDGPPIDTATAHVISLTGIARTTLFRHELELGIESKIGRQKDTIDEIGDRRYPSSVVVQLAAYSGRRNVSIEEAPDGLTRLSNTRDNDNQASAILDIPFSEAQTIWDETVAFRRKKRKSP